MSVLERDKYLDDSIDFLISDIIEYDMKRAGINISKELCLLPSDTIDKLEKMEKHKADTLLGTYQRDDKILKQRLQEGFKTFRLQFGEMNGLEDDDILSVKKDAIYVKKYCDNTKIGKFIEFREKNHYEAYMHLKAGTDNLEFYWKPDGQLDVKGIADSNLELHKPFIIDFIWNFIKYLTQYDDDRARKYLVKFCDDYKNLNLPIGYYREFNSWSNYTYIMYDSPTTEAYLDEAYKPLVVRNYNYLNILVPLLKFVM